MIKSIFKTTIAATFIFTVLAGCGGGGGGGGGGGPFVSWSSIDPPDIIDFDGISQDSTYTAPPPLFAVTNITDNGFSAVSSANVEYRGDGSIKSITIRTPFSSVTWNEILGDIIDESAEIVTMSDREGSSIGIVINAAHPTLGWEYQTFGVWETGRGQGSGTVGAITVGAPTSGDAIPATGVATFTGVTTGTYLDATGTRDYITVSPLTANVDFKNRVVGLSTTGTSKVDMLTGLDSPAPNLDMTGTMTYAAGENAFTGNVVATGLSGTTTGQFYGPNAEELGGVFKLSGADLERYSGGYGAIR